MRLLTVGSLPPEWGGSERGGVATFHAALLAGLLERRTDVEVVGVLASGPLRRDPPVPVFVRPDDASRASFYEEVLDRARPDVVLMNHIANTVGVTHARLGAPMPAVGVIHSWSSILAASGEERERSRAVTAEALGGMSAVAIPSLHALAQGRELGFRYPVELEAIHNPLPPEYMADVDAASPERRDVVYLGGLRPIKNPLALVEAAALLSAGTSVLMVGEGELEGDLRTSIAAHGLGDRVRLETPPQANHLERVRDLLLSARVLCVPSHSESFGIAFIEALACGTPIVGFGPAVREIRDAMGIEVGEPLDTGSAEEIAAAIERVAAATWDRDLLRRAALAAFGLPRIVDRYVRLLRRVTRPSLEGSRLR